MRSVALVAALVGIAGSAHAAGDPAHGAEIFDLNCSACHSIAPVLRNKLGPSLFGVVGRKAGSVETYSYSPAIPGTGLTWTPENLDAYLTNPKKVAPDNRMKFDGLPSADDRADIIAFLSQQK